MAEIQCAINGTHPGPFTYAGWKGLTYVPDVGGYRNIEQKGFLCSACMRSTGAFPFGEKTQKLMKGIYEDDPTDESGFTNESASPE